MLIEDPYSVDQASKEKQLFDLLRELTQHHVEHCDDYGKIVETFFSRECESLADLPYLPVGLFKQHALKSVSDDKVFKTLTSSGTTSSIPSRIFLDAETATWQTKALANIMTAWLGKKRLPMLIIDTPSVIKDRKSFSARGAGILGMMNFGRDHLYALDDQMQLNRDAVIEWVKKHQEGPVLVFGFTFMVWKYFLEKDAVALPDGILIHSGGWKKLQEEAVSNTKFKEALREKAGISRCHGFYGMVEQVGSVFVECEEGYLHPPNFADVIVRDPKTWQEAEQGEVGVIQVLSPLPKSYPGHSLLTEDLGRVVAVDNCGCGRMGKAFEIQGRVPKTELRGCSDTHAYSQGGV